MLHFKSFAYATEKLLSKHFARSCKEIFRRKQKTMVQTAWLNRDETVGLEPSIKLLFLNLLLFILDLHGPI